MINDLPTIFETIAGVVKKQGKEKSSSVFNNSSTKSKANPKVSKLKIKLITVHRLLSFSSFICISSIMLSSSNQTRVGSSRLIRP